MIAVKENHPIPNTFGIAAQASTYIDYDRVDVLRAYLCTHRLLDHPCLHIGSASNLLFTGPYQGTVLHSCISDITVIDETPDFVYVRAGAGLVWDRFVQHCVSHHYYGLENLSGIPGEVGASAVQNIGAYGVEVCELIDRVETFRLDRGERQVFSAEQCEYQYRDSIFKGRLHGRYIVTHVVYKLHRRPFYTLTYAPLHRLSELPLAELSGERVRQEVIHIRDQKLPDPAVEGNAGSFFKNPFISREQCARLSAQYPSLHAFADGQGRYKLSAAWLIDQCGWKGKQLGRAAVHDRQPLVLVNKGGATAHEVMHLADQITRSVKERFGIELEREVNYIPS